MKRWVFNQDGDGCVNLENGIVLKIESAFVTGDRYVLIAESLYSGYAFTIGEYPNKDEARRTLARILEVDFSSNDSLFLNRVFVHVPPQPAALEAQAA